MFTGREGVVPLQWSWGTKADGQWGNMGVQQGRSFIDPLVCVYVNQQQMEWSGVILYKHNNKTYNKAKLGM